MFEVNTEFHIKLAECSGNRLLLQSTTRLMEGAVRYYFMRWVSPQELPPSCTTTGAGEGAPVP